MLDYRCPDCGFYRDTPNHELGCATGRAEAVPRRGARMKSFEIIGSWEIMLIRAETEEQAQELFRQKRSNGWWRPAGFPNEQEFQSVEEVSIDWDTVGVVFHDYE